MINGGTSIDFMSNVGEISTSGIQDWFMFISLSFLGGILVTETLLLGNLFRKYFLDFKHKIYNVESEQNEDEDKNDDINEVIIVRGVPGIGKKNYVYEREKEDNRYYSICDFNEYFETGGKFNFDGKELNKAEQFTFNKFLSSIKNKIQKIYVIGALNEKWMYENYITTASLFKYNVKIVELECLNKEQLLFFNKRSKHNVPYAKSIKLFNNWEYDDRCWIQKSYIEYSREEQVNIDDTGCLITSDSDTVSEETDSSLRYSDFIIENRKNKLDGPVDELLRKYVSTTQLPNYTLQVSGICDILEKKAFNSCVYHFPNFKLCDCEWVEDSVETSEDNECHSDNECHIDNE